MFCCCPPERSVALGLYQVVDLIPAPPPEPPDCPYLLGAPVEDPVSDHPRPNPPPPLDMILAGFDGGPARM